MRIALIGAGGHSKVVQDIVKIHHDVHLMAILDDKFNSIYCESGRLYGPLSYADKLLSQEDLLFIVAIGANDIRKRIVHSLKIPKHRFANVIHPSATISSTVTLGKGIVVMPNAVINADTVVGNHVIVNSGAVVEHDSILENYVHVSPNATITGNVRVGEGTQIGAGATVIPGLSIGYWSLVGAGSTVIHDLPPNCKAVGTPARLIDE